MLKVLELFSGIGACSKALTNLGIEHEIVDSVEIDKYAVQSFNAVHGTNFEPQDITKWDKDIEVDLIMHGSPCQDFSVAGKGAGGDKDSGRDTGNLSAEMNCAARLLLFLLLLPTARVSLAAVGAAPSAVAESLSFAPRFFPSCILALSLIHI